MPKFFCAHERNDSNRLKIHGCVGERGGNEKFFSAKRDDPIKIVRAVLRVGRIRMEIPFFLNFLTTLVASPSINPRDRSRLKIGDRKLSNRRFFKKNGRGGEIRTHDLLYPKQAR